MELRKDFNELSWDVTEEEYRADSAISYSTLSTFAKKGFRGLKEVLDGVKFSSASLRHGSVVDTLLTDADNFDNLYIVAQFDMPSETIKTIVDDIWARMKDAEEFGHLTEIVEKYPEAVLQIIEANNYGGANWKAETKIRKVVEEGESYYNLNTLTSTGKELLSQEDYNLAVDCVTALRNNAYTSPYLTETDDIKIYYQSKFKISFELSDIITTFAERTKPYAWKDEDSPMNTIRCMLDFIVVDYKNKTIRPIDLKTTYAPESEFSASFHNWFYDLQATKYSYILRQVVKNDEYFKDFTILPFTFMPINKFHLSPLLYSYKESLGDSQKTYRDPQGQLHRPWYFLLRDVRWHIANNEFEYSREAVQNAGIVKL